MHLLHDDRATDGHSTNNPEIVFLDDSDPQSREDATDFSTAFALDPVCNGLTLMRSTAPGNRVPNSAYWSLNVFSSPPDKSKMRWSIIRGSLGQGKRTGYATDIDSSPKEAAHKVCTIVQGKGGNVY